MSNPSMSVLAAPSAPSAAARAAASFLGWVADSLDAALEARIETWAVLFSIALLVGAFGFQYVGGLNPCELCLKQRWVHGIAVGVALMGMSAAPSSGSRSFSLFALALALWSCAGVAFFHVGVEQHWWGSSCAMHLGTGKTAEQILAELSATPVSKCDEIAWSLVGISMAGWNALLSFLLAWTIFSKALLTLRGAKLSARMRRAVSSAGQGRPRR